MIVAISIEAGSQLSSSAACALGVVVWFIAGMALLVSGIIAEARIDTRMAQFITFRAQAAAAGDGAINLALAEQEGCERAVNPVLIVCKITRLGQDR